MSAATPALVATSRLRAALIERTQERLVDGYNRVAEAVWNQLQMSS
jgi:hypothetical protein